MKLYTREQMIEAYYYGLNPKGFDWIGDMIDSLSPIELPSDEEIEKARPITLNNPQITQDLIWMMGAKWMKQQILKKNK